MCPANASVTSQIGHEAKASAGQLRAEELQELLLSVNDVTQRLQATHDALQAKVSGLQDELAEANAQLRRSRSLAALGEMAAGIAHEIRNPLASIMLDAQLLADDVQENPELARLTSRIVRGVEGINAIVRDVLSFARDTKIRPVPLVAARVFEMAVDSCEAMICNARIAVNYETRNRETEIEADLTLLVQAVSNLIRNAVEAMVETGCDERNIWLRLDRRRRRLVSGRRAERVVFIVEDSGPGIPHDVIARMFNPFFTTRQSGTGLGLAIVHRIVDAHGGEVAVHNREEGGTRIELWLPQKHAAIHSSKSCAIADIETQEASLDEVVRRRIATERQPA